MMVIVIVLTQSYTGKRMILRILRRQTGKGRQTLRKLLQCQSNKITVEMAEEPPMYRSVSLISRVDICSLYPYLLSVYPQYPNSYPNGRSAPPDENIKYKTALQDELKCKMTK